MDSKPLILFPELAQTVEKARHLPISEDRKEVLQPLINFIQSCVQESKACNLNFICTHNSRRSQFSQVWAQTAGDFFGIPVKCFSGGMEVTACNERTVKSLEKSGFKISLEGSVNPIYSVHYSENRPPVLCFSKLFDDPVNLVPEFAAVMTCDHAEENCPFIPGTKSRIPLHYADPKEFDGTDLEDLKYDERSMQIASEMFYVFAEVGKWG
ncbi:MAG: protein-tyrosine-phosphatase [Algoriphagus sp.]|uniref:protein-tyrosine-phosphatase n=1 Tax=Algoriphagus sp. TaxID=1872435 RepID=UPI0017DE1587|nr:protein-tyrosine-phosphatase [Algoriphagus sp.]NVJ86654.1 protein-tyrosine-phosphatase [Algoriphagus sp.]